MSFYGVATGATFIRIVSSIAPEAMCGLSTISSHWIVAIFVAIVAITVVIIMISVVHCLEILQHFLELG